MGLVGVSHRYTPRAPDMEIEMRAQSWNDILTLLTLMIVKNKLDEDSELEMFESITVKLQKMVAPNLVLTDSFAHDWMAENRSDVAMHSSSVRFDKAVRRLRKNLDGLANKGEVLAVILKLTPKVHLLSPMGAD